VRLNHFSTFTGEIIRRPELRTRLGPLCFYGRENKKPLYFMAKTTPPNLPRGWIGVDLDATLAHYDHWRGIDHIGKPIPAMVERVQGWIAQGINVRIMTARVYPLPVTHTCDGINLNSANLTDREKEAYKAAHFIFLWCEEHIGDRLPVTCQKDLSMVSLWDDRAVQVEPNTGRRIDGLGNQPT